MKTITIVLQDDGNVGIIPGGEISPAMGLAMCKAGTDYYQREVIEQKAVARLAELKQEAEKEESTDAE